MAKTTDRDVKLNTPTENNSQGSIFKTAIIASPIAIGGGMGISQLIKRSSHFGEPFNKISTNQAANSIRDFTNRYASKAHSGTFKDWQLDKLAGFVENTSLSRETIRRSWNRAVDMHDLTGSFRSSTMEKLQHAGSAQEFLKGISLMRTTNSSFVMDKAVSSFLDDIQILNERAAIGQSVDPTVLGSLQGSKGKTIKSSFSLSKQSGKLAEDLIKMRASLKEAGFKTSFYTLQREGLAGSQLVMKLTDKQDKKFLLRMDMPLDSDPNIVVTGARQQTRRIAGQYGIVENGLLKESFNHAEWQARRALEDLIPQIIHSKGEGKKIKSSISDFQKSMIQELEYTPRTPYGSYQSVDKYIETRKNIIRLFSQDSKENKLRQITQSEYYDIVEQGLQTSSGTMPVFPGASPSQAAKGILFTKDVRDAISLVPEAVPYERRPIQALRYNYSPLSSAAANIATNPFNVDFSWAKSETFVDNPMLPISYISSAKDPVTSGLGFHSEGQLLISEKAAARRAVGKVKSIELSSEGLMDIHGILEKHKAKQGIWRNMNETIPAGTVLGYDTNNKLVRLEEDFNLSSAVSFEDTKNKKNYIRLMGHESIQDVGISKVFGGAKGMAIQKPQSVLDQIMSKVAGAPTGYLGQFTESQAIATMDELKKNRGLHYNQMFTSLWEFTKLNMETGHSSSSIASNYAQDPIKEIQRIRKAALNDNKFSHNLALQEIFQISREAQLTPEQMGRVFGAVPTVFGSGYKDVMQGLTEAETSKIQQGIASGATQLFYGGSGGPSYGGIGTVEPRLFEMLDSPYLGSTGQDIKQEIMERLIANNPEKLKEHTALTQSLESLINPSGEAGISPSSFKIGLQSQQLQLGSLGSVKIPGFEDSSLLRPYVDAGSGESYSSDLGKSYENLISNAKKLESGDLSKADFLETMKGTQQQVSEGRIASLTGTSGLLRNKLPGSRYLTAITGTSVGLNEVGVTKPYLMNMLGDLEKSGLYSADALSQMKEDIFKGKGAEGVVMRHPFIGPYSAQPSRIKLIAGSEPVAMFSQKYFNATLHTNKGTEALSNPIRLSPLVGMAGDVDGDQMSVMLAGPQLKPKIQDYLSNPQSSEMYDQYAIRSQLLKAKAVGSEDITLNKLMAGAGPKMGITQGGTLGKISNQLQTARAAVMQHLEPQQQMPALGLLEWMEQTPISGKHIEPGREKEILSLMDDIHHGFQRRRGSAISETVRQIMSNTNEVGRMALEGGMKLSLEDVMDQSKRMVEIPGINIDQTADNIANAMKSFDQTKINGISASTLRSIQMGKAARSVDPSALLGSEASNFGILEGIAQGSAEPKGMRGLGATISKQALSAVNELGNTTKYLQHLGKPVGLGFAASVGLAMVLSQPPRILPTGATNPPAPNLRSGSGGSTSVEGIHSDQEISSYPIATSQVSYPNTARVSMPEARGSNIRIRASSGDRINYSNLSDKFSSSFRNSTTRTSINDRRSSLDKYKINDILENS